MQTDSIPLFSLITQRMTWLSARQAVLSDNVANADTPKFVVRDVKPMDFGNLLARETGLNTTNTHHIKAGLNSSNPVEAMEVRTPGGAPTAVSLEQQMIKLSDTQLQYQTATNLYQKAVGMFRTALSGRF